MENLIDLYHTVSVSPWRDKYVNSFLCGCSEQQVFICNNTSRSAQIAADINSKLNNGTSRIEGLLFLKTFLSQCPDEIFSENALSWALQALNETEGKPKENNQNKIIPLTVLRHIIELSSQFYAVNKLLMPVVPKFLRQLTGYEIQDVIADSQSSCAILECLQSCMKYYSSQCIHFKGAIEKLLFGLIFCTNESVIHEASKCFLLLSLIKPSVQMKTVLTGGGNGQCIFVWSQMLSKLVATMHFALNKLYENAPTYKISSLECEKYDVPVVAEENPVLGIQSSAILYINLCQYLSTMLTHPLPFAKSVALEEVLGIVCKALAVTCSSLKDQVSAESLALSVCIPQVHSASFSILSSIMACSRLNLLSFGPLIIKIIMQSLKWTSVKVWPSGVRKPYSSLRCSAYSCLSLWLRISAAASSAEEVAEELIGIALSDIVPSREKLTLMNADSKKNLHGKRHKRQKVEVAESGTGEESSSSTAGYICALGNGSANSDVCCAALEVITNLLYSVGPFLKPNQHKIIQEKTVSVLIDIQHSSSNYVNYTVIGGSSDVADLILPYQSDARCRLLLYKLLLALVMEPHSHKWPPPLGIAAKLLETGLNDPNIEVSTFCLTSKRSVERILHPSAPTLNFPVTLFDTSDKQPAFLNSLINQIRSRESYTHENITEEEDIILKGKRNARQSIQEISETIESAEPMYSSTSTSRSPSPEIITISDEPTMSTEANQSPQTVCIPVINANPNCERSGASTSDDFVLFRRVERAEGSSAIQEVKLGNIPLTTIQSVGVQASNEPVPNDSISLSPSVASQSDKVLVLKLPIEKSISAETRKDFTQQWKANKENMEKDEDVEGQSEPLEGNILSKVMESQDGGPVNGCEAMSNEVCGLAAENPELENCGEEKNCVVVAGDPGVSKKSPVVTQKIVELDIEHLSESEEMISCFVDAEPDSE